MLQGVPVAADPVFLSFQALGGSSFVVQDLSVSSSEEEEIWAATFSSVEAVAACCLAQAAHTACPWCKAGCQAPWMSLVWSWMTAAPPVLPCSEGMNCLGMCGAIGSWVRVGRGP